VLHPQSLVTTVSGVILSLSGQGHVEHPHSIGAGRIKVFGTRGSEDEQGGSAQVALGVGQGHVSQPQSLAQGQTSHPQLPERGEATIADA